MNNLFIDAVENRLPAAIPQRVDAVFSRVAISKVRKEQIRFFIRIIKRFPNRTTQKMPRASEAFCRIKKIDNRRRSRGVVVDVAATQADDYH